MASDSAPLGTVVSDADTPTFELVRIKLKAGKDVSPNTLVRIPVIRGEPVALIGRIRSAYEYNPNEAAEAIHLRDTMELEPSYPKEEESTTIFRVVEAEVSFHVARDQPMIVKLTLDIEPASTEEARKLGTTPEQLALDSSRERFIRQETPPYAATGRESLADFLRGYMGLLHSSEHVPGGLRISEAGGKNLQPDWLQSASKDGNAPHGYWAFGCAVRDRGPIPCQLCDRGPAPTLWAVPDNLACFTAAMSLGSAGSGKKPPAQE